MKTKKILTILLTILAIILMLPLAVAAVTEGTDVPIDSSFFTWAMLATYAGCLAATIMVTQFVKPLWPPKWATQFLSYTVAVGILILANLFLGSLTAQTAVICILNGIVIALAANGGYSNIKEIIKSVTSKKTDES